MTIVIFCHQKFTDQAQFPLIKGMLDIIQDAAETSFNNVSLNNRFVVKFSVRQLSQTTVESVSCLWRCRCDRERKSCQM